MIQPKGIYRLLQHTARLQREAGGVVDSAQARIDTVVLAIRDTATEKARGIEEGLTVAAAGAEGLMAGPEWWGKWGTETKAREGVAVRLNKPVCGMQAGRVAMLARSLAAWLMRVGWVRGATEADIEAERARQREPSHPRRIADINSRLRTARSIHHAVPNASGPPARRHKTRRARRERVPAH